MSTPVLLEKEASLLRCIARIDEYPSVGAALAAYQAAHGMDVSLMGVPAQRTALDAVLDSVERKGLIVRRSSRGFGDYRVKLTALGMDYMWRHPG